MQRPCAQLHLVCTWIARGKVEGRGRQGGTWWSLAVGSCRGNFALGSEQWQDAEAITMCPSFKLGKV